MMLILEYVPHGDLLGCLRKSRGMDDKDYSCPENFQEEITSYDLLSFAQQIAYGMSFLASKKVWYNILICGKHLQLQVDKKKCFHVTECFELLLTVSRFFTVILRLEIF